MCEYSNDRQGELEEAADQADALVDIYYYSLNAACKKGVNLSSLFDIVHKVGRRWILRFFLKPKGTCTSKLYYRKA